MFFSFDKDLSSSDSEIYGYINNELHRQKVQFQLIASENIVSKSVLEAQGSILTNKYAEGYPNKRYYCGCKWVDEIENLAIKRLCKLFDCKFANVQPHSGSQANQEVLMALLKPGDTILGMSLDCGGHLTHGATVNFSGKWFNSVQYGVDRKNYLINMEEVEELACQHKPALIIAGASSYPRQIDFKGFRKIADKVGAYLLADIAHYSGLIAAKQYPSPIEHSHITTSTTHKTLRGPRGGIIMTNDESIFKKIQSSVFPGLQGGPLMHIVAAKAVAFGEALDCEFSSYIKKVIENAQSLAKVLMKCGFNVITDGTDSHIILVDLRSKKITGLDAVLTLERAGINCNKNVVPFDTEKPRITSGLRLGSAAETSRGLKSEDFEKIGYMINDVIEGFVNNQGNNESIENRIRKEIEEICASFSVFNI